MRFDAPPGARVTVRHRVPGALNDVVGRVVSVDAAVRLERRDGSEVAVPLADVVAWRLVPDRPMRRRRAADVDPDDLMRITGRGWPAIETSTLGEWQLRASGGFTQRGNSVAAHGSPPDDLAPVHAFYADRRLPVIAQAVVGGASHRRLVRAGWSGGPDSLVQVADLEPRSPDPEVRLSPEPSSEWLARYHRVEDATAARAVLAGPRRVAFLSFGAPLVAIGRVVVTGEWAGIAAVEVAPEHRRRGLARRITTTALAWAWEAGADKAYLQTINDNAAAVALYAGFGFADHHRYTYLRPAGRGRVDA